MDLCLILGDEAHEVVLCGLKELDAEARGLQGWDALMDTHCDLLNIGIEPQHNR